MIPNENQCVFCQGRRLRSFHAVDSTGPGVLSIVECKDCQVAWQFPVKHSVSEGTAFFDVQYADPSRATEYFLDDDRINVARMQMGFVSSLTDGPGTLLDVGAGVGYFVREAATNGWQACGIELADSAVMKARSVVGANVINSTLADLSVTSRYDVITMWDVIEHMENPSGEIGEAWGRLRAGGWLVIETGNYQSAVRVELDDKWWLWQGDHRWYFAPPVVERMLRELGGKQFTHATTVFRKGYRRNRQPQFGIVGVIKAFIRSPRAFSLHLRKYRDLKAAYRDWPKWVGLPIVTIAVRKSE